MADARGLVGDVERMAKHRLGGDGGGEGEDEEERLHALSMVGQAPPYFTSIISLTAVPSAGRSFLSVSSLSRGSSFMLRLVWTTVWSVTGKTVMRVPVM